MPHAVVSTTACIVAMHLGAVGFVRARCRGQINLESGLEPAYVGKSLSTSAYGHSITRSIGSDGTNLGITLCEYPVVLVHHWFSSYHSTLLDKFH